MSDSCHLGTYASVTCCLQLVQLGELTGPLPAGHDFDMTLYAAKEVSLGAFMSSNAFEHLLTRT